MINKYKRIHWTTACWAAALFAVLMAAVPPAAAATMPALSMRFVDADTGEPVSGAVALFQANSREGTPTGHGGRRANLFTVEGVTDGEGWLELPAQEFGAQPFALNTLYENPTLLVIKPGYALLRLANTTRIIPTLAEVTVWEHAGSTVRMKRSDASRDMVVAAEGASTNLGFMDGSCLWGKAPRFLVAQDRLVAQWERRRLEERDPGLRIRRPRSLLQVLLANEAGFAKQGCGSLADFFEPYRRR